jgi:hypothetical protein
MAHSLSQSAPHLAQDLLIFRIPNISTMMAAGPTTRAAFSVYKLRARPFDPAASRLRFFGRLNPADPLVAPERRIIFPFCQRLRVRSKGFSQIRRHFVYCTGGDLFLGHGFD